jgi:hypothetical protein
MPRTLGPHRKDVRSKRTTAENTRQAGIAAQNRSPAMLWAYTYQIVPRQTRSQLSAVRALLDQEHSAAKDGSGMFAGRLMVGAQATRILIVSDCPERSCDVNQRLESELKQLQAEFTVSEPVLLADDAATPSLAPESALGEPS